MKIKLIPMISVFVSTASLTLAVQAGTPDKQVTTDKGKVAQMKSISWCQKNYYSASASSRDRKNNARYCDHLANKKFMDKKETKQ